jgi:alginate O-acetyltransferase complex protein AlgI
VIFSGIPFLFFFLPLVLVVYYVAPRRTHNAVLLVASILFYTYGGGALVLLLLTSIVVNYILGSRIERSREGEELRTAKRLLALAVVFNVGMLALFKYTGFATQSLEAALAPLGLYVPAISFLLPIGISFYTFHSLSYVIDIYRGTARHLSRPVDFALYITFFPQLIAGPIVRFHEIRDQLLSRVENSGHFASGVFRFGHGLAKKVLIADTLAPVVTAIFNTPTSELNFKTALIGTAAYTIQLYFDFSGYTDMALGMGEMFGLRLPENFDRPYSSRSITEFWRRWHMSLSRWFRDYVYIPLGGNRVSARVTYRNLIIVFLLVGLWHGANWTFVVWGAYHGTWLLIERWRGIGRRELTGVVGLAANVWTVGLVAIGWIIFRSPTLEYAVGYFGAFFNLEGGLLPAASISMRPFGYLALAAGGVSILLPRDWVTGLKLAYEESKTALGLRLATIAISIPAAVLLVMAASFSPFLYFQF